MTEFRIRIMIQEDYTPISTDFTWICAEINLKSKKKCCKKYKKKGKPCKKCPLNHA